MTRTMRTIGIPAALLALAACGSSEVTGGGTVSPSQRSSTTSGQSPHTEPGPSGPSGTPTGTPSPSGPSGTATGTPSPSGPPRPTAPATSPTLGQGPTGPAQSQQVFPITVERRGGIAGFRDKVVIAADGTATVSHKTGAPESCRVQADLMSQVRAAAGSVAWPGRQTATTPPGRVSDQMWVTVSSGGHHASLTDPQVRKLAAPLTRLLGDITAPAGQRTLCKPV